MRPTLRALAASLPPTLLLMPLLAPAAAQDVTNAYVQVHGGVFLQTGDDLALNTAGPPDAPVRTVVDIDPDPGFAVGGLVGYGVALGFSVEVEATLRSNEVSLGDSLGGALPDTALGEEETAAIMLNGVYTVPVPLLADPYVGIGVGYVKPLGDADAFDGALAYQAKAGLLWPVGIGGILTEVSWLGTEGLEAEDGAAELDYGGVAAAVGYRFSF